MKILLLSDTHGDLLKIDDALEACSGLDMVIHCGDIDRDCDYLEKILPADIAFLAVRGNNDWYSKRPYHLTAALDGIRFYITHGHREHVKSGLDTLSYAAAEQNCTVALFGHTHSAQDTTVGGIRIINPGSLTYPKLSYAVLELKEKQVSVSFHNV